MLNTIATNSFDSHIRMVIAGAIPVLIDYVQDVNLRPTRSRSQSMVSPRNDAPAQAVINPELRTLVESFGDEKVVAVVRGLPGSGKSNLAQQVGQVRGEGLICSADAYFLQDLDGEPTYQFDPTKMKDAHRHCAMMFEEALALEAPTIIVDNTNIRPKEFSEYVADAHERGYKTMVVGIQCRSDADAEMFFRRCVHGVPLNGIMKMKADYTEEGSDVMIPPWGVRTIRTDPPAAASVRPCAPHHARVFTSSLVDVRLESSRYERAEQAGSESEGTSPAFCTAVLADPLEPNGKPAAEAKAADAADTPTATAADAKGSPQSPTPTKQNAGGGSKGGKKKVLKPLKFNAIKILNSLSYNPAMRRELIKAEGVETLMAFAKETLKDQAVTSVRYTSLATNE